MESPGRSPPPNSITSVTFAGRFQQFVTSYGAPVILPGANNVYATPVTATGVPYVVCTTCHDRRSNQRVCGFGNEPDPRQGRGTYAKYFFVNGPYNPDTVNVPFGQAASHNPVLPAVHFSIQTKLMEAHYQRLSKLLLIHRGGEVLP